MPEVEPILYETNLVGPVVVLLILGNPIISIAAQVTEEENSEETFSVGPTGSYPVTQYASNQ